MKPLYQDIQIGRKNQENLKNQEGQKKQRKQAYLNVTQEPFRTFNDSEYILNLIREGEHVHQDFKFEISDARKIAKSLSAFANTEGGRLLIGVKDNGKIAGIKSEEEIYMIESAATMYCQPEVALKNRIYTIEGKHVLEVTVEEAETKPIYALDENKRRWAYVRIKDENILANVVHLNYWKHNQEEEEVMMVYSEREQRLLDILAQHSPLTLNQCSKLSHISRKETSELLADFIRFNLVEELFIDHTFYFQLSSEIEGNDI